MSTTGCCPVGSEPCLASTYTARGKEHDIDGLNCYVVGSGSKAVVVFYDIFGYNGGRTRLICDQLADEGYFVVLPDIYHGEAWGPDQDFGKDACDLMTWLKNFPWHAKIKADAYKVVNYMKSHGADSFGCLGFCAGAYAVFQLCSDDIFKCGLSMHPSVQIGGNFGETPEGIAELIKCPQLIYSASQDLPTYREGGKVYDTLQGKFGNENDNKVFPDMVHGWVTRGELAEANMARDVELAMQGGIAFLKKHM